MLKISKICLYLAIMSLLLPSNFFAFAQENADGNGQGLSDTDLLNEADPEVSRLKEEIERYQNQLGDLDKQKKAYENSIKSKRQEINNLNNRLAIIGDSVLKLELEIKSAELEIQKSDLEISNLNLEMKNQEQAINGQKLKMGGILRTIEANDRKSSYLEVMVLKGDLGAFFKEANEFQALEEDLGGRLAETEKLKLAVEEKKRNLEARRKQLDKLKQGMSEKNERLSGEQIAKNHLLTNSKGQEASFQRLLLEAKAEESQIEADIQNREVSIRKKLAGNAGLVSDDSFIWPVASRKITAYFHDPDYPYRYVFEHPAVDIGSTPYGTPVRAARSGYVAKVKWDGSTGYAYILLVHSQGLSTVYGHISKPYVKEDDFVVQGEVIALSGGTPGTPGAGSLTTGAHLHFEVRMNGIPVDPLSYLP